MSDINSIEISPQVSLKSILDNIREVSEILNSPIDRLDIVNHGPSTERLGENAVTVPSSRLDEIMTTINSIRRKANTLQKETTLLMGN